MGAAVSGVLGVAKGLSQSNSCNQERTNKTSIPATAHRSVEYSQVILDIKFIPVSIMRSLQKALYIKGKPEKRLKEISELSPEKQKRVINIFQYFDSLNEKPKNESDENRRLRIQKMMEIYTTMDKLIYPSSVENEEKVKRKHKKSKHKEVTAWENFSNKHLSFLGKFFGHSLTENLYTLTSCCSSFCLTLSVASIAPILVFSSQIKTEAINPHLTPEITQKYTGSGLSSISKSAPEIDVPLITDTHPWKNVRNSAGAGMWAGAIGMLSMLGNGLTRNKLLNKGISVRG